MNRQDLTLAVLASTAGRPLSPVQLQKSLFLLTTNVPGIVDDGPSFNFVPYDYGPFDADVYAAAAQLSAEGLVVTAQSPYGRWNTYAATDVGAAKGNEIKQTLRPQVRKYLEEVSEWVKNKSFSSLVKSIYDAYPHMRQNSIFRG